MRLRLARHNGEFQAGFVEGAAGDIAEKRLHSQLSLGQLLRQGLWAEMLEPVVDFPDAMAFHDGVLVQREFLLFVEEGALEAEISLRGPEAPELIRFEGQGLFAAARALRE